MVKLIDKGIIYSDGEIRDAIGESDKALFENTITYGILDAHNIKKSDEKRGQLKLKFDMLASHDITYVGIIQTAKAGGIKEFPVPYVLTNCHNSLCAVGGTINEDDHVFGLSAAKKYGGIFVPAHLAVIHTYMRENMARCGAMILGSDSHTRYGALGTLAVGEGGPELAKQLLNKTYDIEYPKVVAIVLEGKPRRGVGPQDVALAIIKVVYDNKFVNNKVMEFIGDGVDALDIEYRNGIDVMTTETTCLASVWKTDKKVEEYFETHGNKDRYKELKPKGAAYYDGAVIVRLDKIAPMIALPFHPKNAYTIKELNENARDILAYTESQGNKLLGAKCPKLNLRGKIVKEGIKADQGIIAGCAGGTYDNIFAAANILNGKAIGSDGFSLSVYPSSQPIYLDLMRKGALEKLISAGGVIKTAFCGPCFGAGDVPNNNAFSIRHTTRNFESREGSKPSDGQISSVALMDARSIAATAARNGILTAATDVEYDDGVEKFVFDDTVYKNRVYNGYGCPQKEEELIYGPNIADWPKIYPLNDTLILKVVSVINDSVTTTDELIPSGETSSYRSNPMKLAEFTLSRKDPEYVGRAKAVLSDAAAIRSGAVKDEYEKVFDLCGINHDFKNVSLGSVIFAKKPGDGSAREQAASCQRVLGGAANIANSYATKRYRSNLINWGMLPLLSDEEYETGDVLALIGIRDAMKNGETAFAAKLVRGNVVRDIVLKTDALTNDEREIILKGCLINYYAGVSIAKRACFCNTLLV
ncbi:MAG: hydratase [Clostridiales bacterium]|jgi:aconitate hydratase|nr:hydratase [Clostridiales bacterium]